MNQIIMYKYLAEQHFWSHKISNMVHLPVMNGWVNACDTVILLSGSNTKTFSRRSLKLANIFGSSPGEPTTIDPISFGFMLKIIRFIVYNSETKSSVSIKGIHNLSSLCTNKGTMIDQKQINTHQKCNSHTFFVTGSSSVA